MLNFSTNINQLKSIIEIIPMNVECRLLYKFQGGQFSRAVFASIFQYLSVFLVNTAGMENTNICQYFCQPWCIPFSKYPFFFFFCGGGGGGGGGGGMLFFKSIFRQKRNKQI